MITIAIKSWCNCWFSMRKRRTPVSTTISCWMMLGREIWLTFTEFSWDSSPPKAVWPGGITWTRTNYPRITMESFSVIFTGKLWTNLGTKLLFFKIRWILTAYLCQVLGKGYLIKLSIYLFIYLFWYIFCSDWKSWIISVPWEAGPDAIVTVSIGLFPKDGGKRAAAAVIGFQMPMTNLHDKFIELTSKSNNSTLMNCAHVWIDCYLLDQNGFVVISEAHNNTGQFMGTQEGAVMSSMVGQGLYNPIEIYDYQAWCEEVVSNLKLFDQTKFKTLLQIIFPHHHHHRRWKKLSIETFHLRKLAFQLAIQLQCKYISWFLSI